MTQEFSPPKFGTDGLRGRAGQPPLDAETMRRLGSALGVLCQRSGRHPIRVVCGNDGRDSAPWIVEALAQGLVAADVAVTDLGLCTTPALAFVARTQPFAAGIMISASHNPAADNGVKIFAGDGRKLQDEDERELEQLCAELRPGELRTPRLYSRPELLHHYEEHLAAVFPELDLTGVKLCLDAAHGGGSELAGSVLRGLGAEVIEVACEPDGFNINDGVGALHPEGAANAMREHNAQLGICLDGDGDRSMFIDEQGNVRDGDDQLCLFAIAMHEQGELPHSKIAATVMSNLGLHHALRSQDLSIHVTPVGDRNVVQAMREHGFELGGEQSGHILFGGDGHLTGDGLFTALKLLSVKGVLDNGFARAFASFRRFPQKLINVQIGRKPDLNEVPAIAAKVKQIEETLGEDGRLLLRYSGTEPLCRVMIEAADGNVVDALCQELADLVAVELA